MGNKQTTNTSSCNAIDTLVYMEILSCMNEKAHVMFCHANPLPLKSQSGFKLAIAGEGNSYSFAGNLTIKIQLLFAFLRAERKYINNSV